MQLVCKYFELRAFWYKLCKPSQLTELTAKIRKKLWNLKKKDRDLRAAALNVRSLTLTPYASLSIRLS